jgi:hypothetical protein
LPDQALLSLMPSKARYEPGLLVTKQRGLFAITAKLKSTEIASARPPLVWATRCVERYVA